MEEARQSTSNNSIERKPVDNQKSIANRNNICIRYYSNRTRTEDILKTTPVRLISAVLYLVMVSFVGICLVIYYLQWSPDNVCLPWEMNDTCLVFSQEEVRTIIIVIILFVS